MVPTPGTRPTQLAARMKMKTVPKNQNVRSHQVRADDALEQPVETFDQPLQQVLRPAGNLRHPPRRHLREDDQADARRSTSRPWSW